MTSRKSSLSIGLLLAAFALPGFQGCAAVKSQKSSKIHHAAGIKPSEFRRNTILFFPVRPEALEVAPTADLDLFPGFKPYEEERFNENTAHLENKRAWVDSLNAQVQRHLKNQALSVRNVAPGAFRFDTLPAPRDDQKKTGIVPAKNDSVAYEVPAPNYFPAGQTPQVLVYLWKVRVEPTATQAWESHCVSGSCYGVKVRNNRETELVIRFHYTIWDYTQDRLVSAGTFEKYAQLSNKYPLTKTKGSEFVDHLLGATPLLRKPQTAGSPLTY